MEKQYVVRMDRSDGQYPETVFGPTCLRDCAFFVKGWYEELNLDALETVPEIALFRIYIVEVQA